MSGFFSFTSTNSVVAGVTTVAPAGALRVTPFIGELVNESVVDSSAMATNPAPGTAGAD